MQMRLPSTAAVAIALLLMASAAAPAEERGGARQSIQLAQSDDAPMVITPQPGPGHPPRVQGEPLPPPDQGQDQAYGRDGPHGTTLPPEDNGGPGRPYEPAPGPGARGDPYVPPEAQDGGTFSVEEIKETGHRFFGRVSMDLAKVVEYAFHRAGRPNGYILGEEAGGAFIAGLRYGEGTLYTKDAGDHRVYWQGPSLGYDFGAEGSKTMVLVYDLRSPAEIFSTFGGIDGSAYFIGGVGITFLTRSHVILAPIRSGVGLRLGANVGYLKYTREPTWNPF
jgi:hypothetical protein